MIGDADHSTSSNIQHSTSNIQLRDNIQRQISAAGF